MHLRLLTALCNDTLEGANMRAELAGRVDQISALQSERHQTQLEVHGASHAVRTVVPVQLEVWCCLCCCVGAASGTWPSCSVCAVARTVQLVAQTALPCQHCLVSTHTRVPERQTDRQQVDLAYKLRRQLTCCSVLLLWCLGLGFQADHANILGDTHTSLPNHHVQRKTCLLKVFMPVLLSEAAQGLVLAVLVM